MISARRGRAGDSPSVDTSVAVIRYPTASNLDEFKPLDSLGALRWAREPSELEDAELVVLPGSKHVAAGLGWFHRSGLAEEVRRRAARGRAVLGICGGMQMLGDRLDNDGDADGTIEAWGCSAAARRRAASKRTERTTVTFAAGGSVGGAERLGDQRLVADSARSTTRPAPGSARRTSATPTTDPRDLSARGVRGRPRSSERCSGVRHRDRSSRHWTTSGMPPSRTWTWMHCWRPERPDERNPASAGRWPAHLRRRNSSARWYWSIRAMGRPTAQPSAS